MGCCVQRAKFEDLADQDPMLKSANLLPTYENITSLYDKVGLMPSMLETLLPAKKEQMLFMIINLIRVKPTVFIHQLNTFKMKCDMR